jgi:hypothetical protein
MANKLEILHEGHESWETLIIKQKWTSWEFSQCSDGDVEICCDGENGSQHLFLNQDELPTLIKFLQTKVK